jgi:hypothetical protein
VSNSGARRPPIAPVAPVTRIRIFSKATENAGEYRSETGKSR